MEWGSYGIRVNGIAPGPIADTPGMAKLSVGLGRDDANKHVGTVCVAVSPSASLSLSSSVFFHQCAFCSRIDRQTQPLLSGTGESNWL